MIRRSCATLDTRARQLLHALFKDVRSWSRSLVAKRSGRREVIWDLGRFEPITMAGAVYSRGNVLSIGRIVERRPGGDRT